MQLFLYPPPYPQRWLEESASQTNAADCLEARPTHTAENPILYYSCIGISRAKPVWTSFSLHPEAVWYFSFIQHFESWILIYCLLISFQASSGHRTIIDLLNYLPPVSNFVNGKNQSVSASIYSFRENQAMGSSIVT